MAQTDWNFIGTGSWAIIEASPSGAGNYAMRLIANMHMLWNGNSNIGNTEIVAWARANYVDSSRRGYICFILRSQSLTDLDNAYLVQIVPLSADVVRVQAGYWVNGEWTLLAYEDISLTIKDWRQYRVRIKDYTIQIEYYDGANWVLLFMVNDPDGNFASGAAGIACRGPESNYSWADFDEVQIGEETA